MFIHNKKNPAHYQMLGLRAWILQDFIAIRLKVIEVFTEGILEPRECNKHDRVRDSSDQNCTGYFTERCL